MAEIRKAMKMKKSTTDTKVTKVVAQRLDTSPVSSKDNKQDATFLKVKTTKTKDHRNRNVNFTINKLR